MGKTMLLHPIRWCSELFASGGWLQAVEGERLIDVFMERQDVVTIGEAGEASKES